MMRPGQAPYKEQFDVGLNWLLNPVYWNVIGN